MCWRRAMTRRRNCLAGLGGGAEGTAAVEFALAMPILMALIVGGIEFGQFLWQQHVVTSAAREGAKAASLYSKSGGPSVQSVVTNYILNEGALNAADVSVTVTNQTVPGDSSRILKVVTVQIPFTYSMVPAFFQGFNYVLGGNPVAAPTVTITGRAKMWQEYD